MTGRDVSAATRAGAAERDAGDPATSRVAGRSADSRSILRGGEILGLAGLVGAGRTCDRPAHRRLRCRADGHRRARSRGEPFRPTPRAALERGIVYLTEDRKRDGIFAAARRHRQRHRRRADRSSRRFGSAARGARSAPPAASCARLRLVAASLDAPIASLSGGNQQKVIFAPRPAGEAEGCSSATSRRAASMSAPRRRSTPSCASSPPTASAVLVDLVGDRGAAGAQPPHRGHARTAASSPRCRPASRRGRNPARRVGRRKSRRRRSHGPAANTPRSVAVAQMHCVPGDVDANLRRIECSSAPRRRG